ncbi:MAG: type VI secretion system baseplate subunit TssF [Phycisphaerales bacterium]
MDERLLRHYNRELQHLREMGGEFAREFPKIAGRLGLEDLECADPYVERLLEGFAFLAARVQLQMEAEFPRFTQYMFETMYPHYLSPTPSMGVVQFVPDLSQGSLAEGPIVARGSQLRSQPPQGSRTRCTFTTAHDVQLWPLEIVEAAYHTRDLASLGLQLPRGARAALRLRLRTTDRSPIAALPLDSLTIHLRRPLGEAVMLYEQLFAQLLDVVVHSAARPPQIQHHIGKDGIEQVGFTPDEALLPYGPRSFQGYRLLQEYFAFPTRFMFVALRGLNAGAEQVEGSELDITCIFNAVNPELENTVSATDFALFCTPVVNLFEKRLDRIHVTDRFSEFHVISDRTAPLDFEVHSLLSVHGYGSRSNGEEQLFESFYRARDTSPSAAAACYYAARRMPRTLNQNEQRGRRRSSYPGSELYISLVDSADAPYSAELRQLGLRALCTNRDLPVLLAVGKGASDFTLESGDPVASIRVLGSLTAPLPSHADSGEVAWRLISHMTPNYLSLTDTEGGDAASALRDVLVLYADPSRPEIRKQIDGVRAVHSSPATQRITATGPAAFARGLAVNVTFDETAFEGFGIFVLGAVLDRFFARYVTMNVFTTTSIHSAQRGKVAQWPARTGQLRNL